MEPRAHITSISYIKQRKEIYLYSDNETFGYSGTSE